MALGGYRRDCPNCNAQFFPRTEDPVAIMLAIDGERLPDGPAGALRRPAAIRLAGFVENAARTYT